MIPSAPKPTFDAIAKTAKANPELAIISRHANDFLGEPEISRQQNETDGAIRGNQPTSTSDAPFSELQGQIDDIDAFDL
jgi:hypothetical protein